MYQSQTVIGITPARKDPPLQDCTWPEDALHFVPDWVYTSQAVYEQEQDRNRAAGAEKLHGQGAAGGRDGAGEAIGDF